jgi:type I restriction enzyme S subunit
MAAPMMQISHVASQIRGVTYSKEEATNRPDPDRLPILRANNITDEGLDFTDLVWVPRPRISEQQRLKSGDILIATSSGSIDVVGKAARVASKFDGSFGAFCKVVRPGPRIDSAYLAHFFRTPTYRAKVSNLAAGANINNLRNEHIDSLELPVPPLAEQRRIAVILDRADGIRRKRQQALRLADEFLRSVFVDLFGDPATNPKGWPVLPLSAGVIAFEGGRNLNPTDAPRSDGVRILKVSAVTSGEYRPYESKSFGEDEQVLAHEFVRTGDLLISRANTAQLVGAVAYVWHTERREMLPDKLWRFVWSEPRRIEPLFMLHMARSSYFRHQLIQRATGTSGSMKNIGKSKMLEIPIPLPPIARQQQFAAIAIKARRNAEHCAEASRESDTLFSVLQQRAFLGKL